MNNVPFIAAIVLFVLFVLVGIVIFKEVRTHLFWRRLVAEGDLDAIGQILAGEIDRWQAQRPPKGVSAAIWAGVQGMELIYGTRRLVYVGSTAEAEFRLVEGERTQVATALDTAFATAALLVEMILYDVPNLRPAYVRVDVYTTFRDESGVAVPRPILSLTADRETAAPLDWDWASPDEIMQTFSPLYRLSDSGEPLAIELSPPPQPLEDEREDLEADVAAGADAGRSARPR